MSTQSTAAREQVAEKRRQLKAIVERLGPDAEPPVIREQAYRDGFGKIHNTMLISVRNELWPDRIKHAGGRRKGPATESEMVIPVHAKSSVLIPCPKCQAPKTRVRSRALLVDGRCRRYRFCPTCDHRFDTIHRNHERNPHPRRAAAMLATHKYCPCCRETLTVDRFIKKTDDAHLLRTYCKDCLRKKSADAQRKRSFKNHLLTEEQYKAILESQGGGCAICGTTALGKRRLRFDIDHCHTSGAVRGLLCSQCNTGIGNLREDESILRAAIEYLQRAALRTGGT